MRTILALLLCAALAYAGHVAVARVAAAATLHHAAIAARA